MTHSSIYSLAAVAAFSLFGQNAVIEARAAEQVNVPAEVHGMQPADDERVAYEPVLGLIRDYSGPRDGNSLEALFSRPANPVVRQSPAIALSDGKTAVIIAASITPIAGSPVNFSLEGANLISMKIIKGEEWQIKAMPDTGTMRMALVVMQGNRKIKYPLTVAPPVPEGTDLTVQGYQAFFEGESGRLDLNKDGRKDYQDDYLFLANYLAKQNAAGRDRSARKQRALQRSLTVVPAPPRPEFNPDDFPD